MRESLQGAALVGGVRCASMLFDRELLGMLL